jgi:serine/threonine protein kinase
LKLENFLFEEKNCNSPLVLIDFGLSKHFDPDDKLTHRGKLKLSAACLSSSLATIGIATDSVGSRWQQTIREFRNIAYEIM